MVNQLEILNITTKQFFFKYIKELDIEIKKWNLWDFKSEIEYNEMPGCYALLTDEKIIYIGVGAGKNSGKYENAGLGQRLHNYWRVDKDNSKKGFKIYTLCEKWQKKELKEKSNINIATFGIEPEHRCLAYALEIFLIENIKPVENFIHNG